MDRFSCNPQADLTSEFTFLNLTMSCQLTSSLSLQLLHSCSVATVSPAFCSPPCPHTLALRGSPDPLAWHGIPLLLPALLSLLSSPPPQLMSTATEESLANAIDESRGGKGEVGGGVEEGVPGLCHFGCLQDHGDRK